MAVEQLTDGGTEGSVLGRSADKLAFFGATPSVRATLTALATAATLATVTASVQEIIAELQSKGITL
jgi:hypothetical protein